MLSRRKWDATREEEADKALSDTFGQIYQKHEQALQRFVCRVVKSDSQAEDIVQDVFIKVWEYRHQLDSINNIEDWLYRVTENRMIDFLRKAAADARLRDALWKKTQGSTHETEEVLQARECSSMIQQAVSQLPPQRKLVYHLNREKGLNHEEIAEALSISRHTVKNHLAMALRSIQRMLTNFIF